MTQNYPPRVSSLQPGSWRKRMVNPILFCLFKGSPTKLWRSQQIRNHSHGVEEKVWYTFSGGRREGHLLQKASHLKGEMQSVKPHGATKTMETLTLLKHLRNSCCDGAALLRTSTWIGCRQSRFLERISVDIMMFFSSLCGFSPPTVPKHVCLGHSETLKLPQGVIVCFKPVIYCTGNLPRV